MMELKIVELYQYFSKHPVVTTDSRNCPVGSIFFALKGDAFDGNKFAVSAIEKGCSLAVVDDASLMGTPNLFFVDDVLVALQKLANYHRQQLNIPIIGITGSNGKTTTKELVSTVLSKRHVVYYTKGNLNNHIGVPLTLLAMDCKTEIGVVEMGANHPGEIAQLCEIADPDYGIITNIGKAHIEGFGSYEGVRKTKGELYDCLNRKLGHVFVNADDEVLMEMSEGMSRDTYSALGDANVIGSDIEVNPYLTFMWKTSDMEHSLPVNSQMVGKYNINNFLAAACVGIRFGVAPEDICSALSEYVPANNRSQLIKTEHNQILMDAYNANPSSMQVALDNFNAIEHPYKIGIIGAMKELGHISEEEHQKVYELLVTGGFSKVFLVGDEFSFVVSDHKIKTYQTAEDVIAQLKENPTTDAFILIKGSRGNKLETVLPYIQ